MKNKKIERLRTKTPDFYGTESLAIQLSELLNNPKLPKPIYNAVMTAVNDIFNANSSALSDFEASPEYLKRILAVAQNTRGEK